MRPACIISMVHLLVISFLFLSPAVFAQTKKIANLHSAGGNQPDRSIPASDSAYVDTLNARAHAFYGVNADSAFSYSKKALEYAGRAHYEKGEAESWRMLGNTYELIGDYTNMLSSYHQSLAIALRIGNTRQIVRANVNIALFYKQVGEYDKALELMEKVSELCTRSGDTIQSVYVFSHLSDLAFREKKFDKALEYDRQALRIADAVKDGSDIASINNDIGKILAANGSHKEAIEHYLQSLQHYRQLDDKLGLTVTYAFLAQSCLRLKDYTKALQYAEGSLAAARAIRRRKESGEAARILADIYTAKGDDHHAIQYFKLFKDYSDSLFNDQTRNQIYALAARYEYEQEEAQLRREAEKKDALHQQALHRATLEITIASLLIFFLIILAFVLLRSRRANRRSHQLLLEKNSQIEEQKEAMEHQAVQLLLNNQQKDKLFSIIAHDLRGPLNSLKGLMDFLKERKLSEQEITSMMNELRRNVDYSSELVGNLLFWASSQLNGIVVTPVILPLQPTVNGILALYAQPAKEKQVLLQQEITPGLSGYADKDMVQVVLRNLLSNAIKFCRAGDSVIVSVYRLEKEIEVCVADTGIGIKEEVLEKIRGNESVTSYGTAKEKGTGLGMLLCKEFTEANKGRFRIESEWGNGCRCYFTIPAAMDVEPAAI